MQALLLYVQPYKIISKETGEINSGLSLWFNGKESLKPIEREKNGEIIKGVKPFKGWLPYEAQKKINEVPGLYEIEYMMEGNSDNKPQMVITDIEFLGRYETKLIEIKQLKQAQ